jgi:hypothetical protein
MSSSITGLDHFISLDKAVEMTTVYRAEKENILIPELRGQNILLKSETFDRSAFDAVLAQDGCLGIRIYFGMEDGLKVRLLAVGVAEGNIDMLPNGTVGLSATGDGGKIIENGQPCPELCPPDSPLDPGP